jgi:four helix bundle protein
MGIKSYRDLSVWQVGMDLAATVYDMTRKFPNHEKYGLGSQLERAAVSITANIAEGHAKDSTKQFLFHVSVAMGSVAESETHLMLAERLGYGEKKTIADLLVLCERIGKMLHNLQKTLKAKLEPS